MAPQTVSSGPAPSAAPRPIALLGWIVGLAVAGGLLVVVCGPPPLPRALPSWEAIVAAAGAPILPGDRPPLALLLAGLSWVLWGLYAVLALSVAVSIAEVLVERFIPALAPAVGGLARRLAIPVVRQAVRASLAASLVVAPLPSVASAGPGPQPAPIVRVAEPQPPPIAPGWPADHTPAPPAVTPSGATPGAPADTAWHAVRAGDALTAIADWYADDPLAYARIADDNDLGQPNLSTSSAFVMHFDLRKKEPIAQRPNLMGTCSVLSSLFLFSRQRMFVFSPPQAVTHWLWTHLAPPER